MASNNKKTNNKNKQAPKSAQTVSGDTASLNPNTQKIETTRKPMTIISSKTIDDINVDCFVFTCEQFRKIGHIRLGLSMAKELQTALTHAKFQVEALSMVGSETMLGLNQDSIFFSKDADAASKELFPKLYSYLCATDRILQEETQRLQKALNAYNIEMELDKTRCIETGISERSVGVVELVRETGFNYWEVEEIICSLIAAKPDRISLPEKDDNLSFSGLRDI